MKYRIIKTYQIFRDGHKDVEFEVQVKKFLKWESLVLPELSELHTLSDVRYCLHNNSLYPVKCPKWTLFEDDNVDYSIQNFVEDLIWCEKEELVKSMIVPVMYEDKPKWYCLCDIDDEKVFETLNKALDVAISWKKQHPEKDVIDERKVEVWPHYE